MSNAKQFPFSCVIYALHYYYENVIKLMTCPAINYQPREVQAAPLWENYQENLKARVVSISICFSNLNIGQQTSVHKWFLMEGNPAREYRGFYVQLESGLIEIANDMMQRDGLIECQRGYTRCRGWCIRSKIGRRRRS